MRYRFKKTVIVETHPEEGDDGLPIIKNIQAEAGQEIDEDDLPKGTLASLLGTKSLERIESKPAKKGPPAKTENAKPAEEADKDKETKK
jgi:hypothetical protein